MQRINDDGIFFENISLYGSNIVTNGSSGLGEKIYYNISDIDFFRGNVNSTETIVGKELYSLNKSNVYKFDKKNLLEYMTSMKDEFILRL